jgi:PAS domain S-box-containing protein
VNARVPPIREPREPPATVPAAPAALPSAERYRQLIDCVRDYAIFMLDIDGNICSWNRGAEEIHGYREPEVMGRNYAMLYLPEDVAEDLPHKELLVAQLNGRAESEGWRLHRDGSRHWARMTLTALHDEAGELNGFSVISLDLTERRRKDDALRHSEERLRLLVESVQDSALFMLDPLGFVDSWNAGAERIKGYRAEEIIGQHFSRFYPPEALAQNWPQELLAMARTLGRAEDSGWRLRRDGSRFWASVVLSALYDRDGRLRGYAKITRDLTDRRRMQTLEEEGRQTTEFLAMLAHELRNPLAPIRNAVQWMQRSPLRDPTLDGARDIIDRQVAHLSHLVDDLLDVGRIATGTIALRSTALDLSMVAARAIETSLPLMQARRQSFHAEMPDQQVLVQGDQTRLMQIVMNLLNNAAKYTPENGAVFLKLEAGDREATLTVSDTGIGIAPELLPRIFDLFMQGRRTLARSEGGLGIGLTLVKRLVALHGGEVAAFSEGPDRGSRFVVRLPLLHPRRLSGPPSPLASATESPAAGVSASRRVLVIDDNQDSTTSMAMLLKLVGHEVCVAADGNTGLREAERFLPQVVLLDIGLPDINGYEVARRLRQHPSLQSATLIAMTGYGQPEDRQRSSEAGFHHHLVKPVDWETLERLLATT